MDAATPAPRRVLPIVIVVIAVVIGFVSVLAVWVKRQALETDTWTETSTELLENEEIRDALSDFLVDELYANVDVEAKVEGVLPRDLKPLAGPIAGGLRQAANQVAREALAHPKFQAAWEDANRVAHQRLLAVIDDKGEFVSTGGGVVTLDLKGIAARVGTEVGLPASLADKLPPDTA